MVLFRLHGYAFCCWHVQCNRTVSACMPYNTTVGPDEQIVWAQTCILFHNKWIRNNVLSVANQQIYMFVCVCGGGVWKWVGRYWSFICFWPIHHRPWPVNPIIIYMLDMTDINEIMLPHIKCLGISRLRQKLTELISDIRQVEIHLSETINQPASYKWNLWG